MRVRAVALGLAAVLGLAGGAHAKEEELITYLVDTGPVPCDNTARYNYWTNPFPFDLKIKSITMWMGLFEGAKADLGAWVLNHTGMVARYAHDRYANPSVPGEVTYNYQPDFIRLRQGDHLAVGHLCTKGASSLATQTHLWVLITYKG